MQQRQFKLILVGLIALALVAAGYLAAQRHVIEKHHRTVSLAVVYDEVVTMARMHGMGTVELLRQLRQQGVGTVLIKEPTLREAEQSGTFKVMGGGELLMGSGAISASWPDELRRQIKQDYQYVMTSSADDFQRLAGQWQAKGVQVQTWEEQNLYILEAGYHSGRLTDQLGTGIPAAATADVDAAGLNIMVQLRSWDPVTPQGLGYVMRQLKDVPNLTGVLFNDPRLPGYPREIKTLAYLMQDLKVPLVQIEFVNQMGLANLGLLLDKNMLRLHTITLEEDAKRNYTDREMVDRMALAAKERNISVLLLHMYMKAGETGETGILDFNLGLAQQLQSRLSGAGLQVGEAQVLGHMVSPRPLLLVIGLGVIAGGVLLLLSLGWTRWWLPVGLLALLLWLGLLAAGMISLGCKMMALAAVIIFPTLALVQHVPRSGGSVGHSVMLLLRTSLFSFMGALLMVGLLANSGFMLKLDQFAGVKLAHVIPLLFLAGYFLLWGREAHKQDWRSYGRHLLAQPVTVKLALVSGVLLLALLVYVSRTGNESMVVSSLELKFRTMLDTVLGVRPRTKEFLLGHPLLLLLFYTGYRHHGFLPLLLLGAIGQISLVNTYAHIHTPLLVSLTRSFHGLWIGILGGLALIVLWKLASSYGRRKGMV